MVGNQPRMQASSFDGSELRFDFLDATNLSRPGAGHMHQALFRFEGAGAFTTEWTWVEDGQSKFTERVRFTRQRDAS